MKSIIKKGLVFFIGLIERYESRSITYLPPDDFSDKIQNTLNLNSYQVLTDTGYQPIASIHITKPYDIWEIKTHTGRQMRGADSHILFDNDLNQVFIKDLAIGDKLLTMDGIESVVNVRRCKSRVQMFDATVEHLDHRYYTNGFLSHNTVTASIFNAWYLTFNFDKNTLLLANKSESTKEIIDKAKLVVENLPFFLKPGILKYDVMNIRCDNGCRLVGQATTAKSGIGFTIHNLYLDEFAHIHPTIVDSFYENVYPTLSASKVSRINITSTPNGYNKFYEIYSAANKGDNEYKATRIDWWQHPDRNDAWYKRELSNLGSIEAFNRQYGNEFVNADSLLLDPITMKKLRKRSKKYEFHDLEEFENIRVEVKDFLFFQPDFDPEEASDSARHWVFSIDIAEGNGGDHSIINIFELLPMSREEAQNVITPSAMYDFFKLKQVAVFRSNQHMIEDFAKIIYTLAIDIFNRENVKMVIEYNTYGSILIKYLQTCFPGRNEFDDDLVLKFKHRHDAKGLKPGIKLKSDNKSIFCQTFKKMVETDRIFVDEFESVSELSNFGTLTNGSYGAQVGNDDLVMSSVLATQYFNTVEFADAVEEILDEISEDEHEFFEKILYSYTDEAGDLNYDVYDILG